MRGMVMLKQGSVGSTRGKDQTAAWFDENPQPRPGGLMLVRNDRRNWSSRQYLAVRGRGSWSAAFRRPQFKHANTVIASPASKSTARSGNIVPRHLSQVFMTVTLTFTFEGAYPSEVRGHDGI